MILEQTVAQGKAYERNLKLPLCRKQFPQAHAENQVVEERVPSVAKEVLNSPEQRRNKGQMIDCGLAKEETKMRKTDEEVRPLISHGLVWCNCAIDASPSMSSRTKHMNVIGKSHYFFEFVLSQVSCKGVSVKTWYQAMGYRRCQAPSDQPYDLLQRPSPDSR